MVPPELYFRIAFLMVGRDLLVTGFSVQQFLVENGTEIIKKVVADNGVEILKNAGAQVLGYGFGVLTERPFEPTKLLPPIISCIPDNYDFIEKATGATRAERIATLALLYSGTGLLSKTGDTVINTAAGGFIFLLAQYIEAVAKSSGGGPTPFLVLVPNRRFRRFSRKQHIQCQLAIVGIIILTTGCFCVLGILVGHTIIFTRTIIKKFKKTLKYLIPNRKSVRTK